MNRTRNGLLRSWALLVALTLATTLLGAQESAGGHGLPFGMAGVVAVLAFALVKVDGATRGTGGIDPASAHTLAPWGFNRTPVH